MPYSTIPSLASSTGSSPYLKCELVMCPYIVQSPKPSRISLESFSLHTFNTISDKQLPYLLLFHSTHLLPPHEPVTF
jgi:hypothetical protein